MGDGGPYQPIHRSSPNRRSVGTIYWRPMAVDMILPSLLVCPCRPCETTGAARDRGISASVPVSVPSLQRRKPDLVHLQLDGLVHFICSTPPPLRDTDMAHACNTPEWRSEPLPTHPRSCVSAPIPILEPKPHNPAIQRATVRLRSVLAYSTMEKQAARVPISEL
jgi:hypothetical protein